MACTLQCQHLWSLTASQDLLPAHARVPQHLVGEEGEEEEEEFKANAVNGTRRRRFYWQTTNECRSVGKTS